MEHLEEEESKDYLKQIPNSPTNCAVWVFFFLLSHLYGGGSHVFLLKFFFVMPGKHGLNFLSISFKNKKVHYILRLHNHCMFDQLRLWKVLVFLSVISLLLVVRHFRQLYPMCHTLIIYRERFLIQVTITNYINQFIFQLLAMKPFTRQINLRLIFNATVQ